MWKGETALLKLTVAKKALHVLLILINWLDSYQLENKQAINTLNYILFTY